MSDVLTDLQRLIWLSAYAAIDRRTPAGSEERLVSTLRAIGTEADLALQEDGSTKTMLGYTPEQRHVWAGSFVNAYLAAGAATTAAPNDGARRAYALRSAQASVDALPTGLLSQNLNQPGGYGLRLVTLPEKDQRVPIIKRLRDLGTGLNGALSLLQRAERGGLLLDNSTIEKALHWQDRLSNAGLSSMVVEHAQLKTRSAENKPSEETLRRLDNELYQWG